MTHPKISLLSVLFSTNFAIERFFPSVSHQMSLHCGDTYEFFSTNATYW